MRPYYGIDTCNFCGRALHDLVVITIGNSDFIVCIRCFLSYALHETIKAMIFSGREEDFRYALRVLEGINDLIEDNPLIQCIRFVIDQWAQKYPEPLYKSELEYNWSYTRSLQRVLDYLRDEGILVEKTTESNRIILVPGDLLQELLKKYPPTTRAFFRDVIKAITGLAAVRYLVDPSNPKLRSIYAVLQALKVCIENSQLKPYYRINKYYCKLCNPPIEVGEDKFAAESHLEKVHGDRVLYEGLDECFSRYIEVRGVDEIGVKCDYDAFVEWASIYGIRTDKFMRHLLSRGVVLPEESYEAMVEENGKRKIIVDIAWVRAREYMLALERQIVRSR